MKKILFMLVILPTFVNAAEYKNSEYLKNAAAFNSINLSSAYTGKTGAEYSGFSGKGVTVAVIDSGSLLTHQDLASQINQTLQDPTFNPTAHSHGTAVSSIIAGAKNDLGMQGVAYGANVLSFAINLKDSDGNPTCPSGCLSLTSIISKLKDSEYNDVKIINASFGSSGSIVDAFVAQNLGTKLLVAAAGNEMSLNPSDLANFPASGNPGAQNIKNIINVVSFDPTQNRDSSAFLAGYTNLAGTAADWTITAPGNFLYTATSTNDTAYNNSFSGTSAAAPVVSGAAALVQEAFPFMTGKQIGDVLLSTADKDFSKFSPYIIQTSENSSGTTVKRFIFFTDNTQSMTLDTALEEAKITCGGTVECSEITYNQAYGAGILNVGSAVMGLGSLDANRLSASDFNGTQYSYTINTNGYSGVFGNNIGQVMNKTENTTANVGLNKDGAGELVLAGKNTYLGDTKVRDGSLTLTGSIAGNALVTSGSFDVEGGTVSGDVSVSTNGSFSLMQGELSKTVSNNGTFYMDAGAIKGNVENAGRFNFASGNFEANIVNKAGGNFNINSGNLVLSGTNTFTNEGTVNYYGGKIETSIDNTNGTFQNYGYLTTANAFSAGKLVNTGSGTIAAIYTVDNFDNTGNIALIADETGALKKMTVSGTANLTAGRFVGSSFSEGAYEHGVKYTVLSAGTLNVDASFQTDVRLIGMINGVATTSGNNLDITVDYLKVSDAVNTPLFDEKERKVAGILDNLFFDQNNRGFGGYYYYSEPELKKVINNLRDQVQSVSVHDLPLSGTLSNNVYSHLFRLQQQRQANPMLNNSIPTYRYRTQPYYGRSGGYVPKNNKIWAQAIGAHGRMGADAKTSRPTAISDMYGGQIGWDHRVSKYFLWGVTAGFAYTDTDQGSDKMQINDYRLGMYASARAGRVNLDGVVSGGWQQYEGTRHTDVTGMKAISKADYNGYTVEGSLNLGIEALSMPRRDYSISLRPYVSSTASYIYQEEYTEKGSNPSANLAVSDSSDTTVSVQPGLQIGYTWSDAVLTLDLGYQHLVSGGNPMTSAYFVTDALQTRFDSLATSADKDYISVGLGLESNLSRNVRANIWVYQKRSENNTISTISGAIMYSF